MLTIYNTLTGKKEPFQSLVPGTVRMYVCGVTVYDYCHIGHARSALVFDVIRRYLEYSGYRVEFAKNFTDVDDKIIKRANEQGVSCETITTKFIQAYYEDMGKLGVRPASIEPKATDHMADIIRLAHTLVVKGMAYQIDGDVYFEVAKYPDYGRLSRRKTDDLQAGARVEVDERKRHPMDFALWKSSKPGEPAWDSPWGPGRPGWHIECSAMSIKHLGETFDIHGGGMDLIFPHHENEIAQSCGATGKEFARYWVHNGFVQIDQEKMSKSLGNFFTIREIFEKSEWREEVTGEVLRYFLLSTHYHSPLDFSNQALKEAKQALDGFYDLFNRLSEKGEGPPQTYEQLMFQIRYAGSGFQRGMDDDFNTPVAIAELQSLRNEVNKLFPKGLSREARSAAREAFRSLGKVLGLFQLDKWQFMISPGTGSLSFSGSAVAVKITDQLSDDAIEALLSQRSDARRKKDFKKADDIRKQLTDHGIIIEDKPDGTSRWKR
ncbi:cysteine--tRNA ligase [Nitrospira moscoviensis]|uniref:Cysteine--tRNA ligase n=1 Tax=Nitrospira moscoviensis TaxID=42253 RepID=A0A0K2GIP6_NITMO|nr:cysteine--tRNA ligase [Nitrospira moscoviensis]ALA60833.1 Cysteine--tRNA ligase [Nitrospira moscoviensis]